MYKFNMCICVIKWNRETAYHLKLRRIRIYEFSS